MRAIGIVLALLPGVCLAQTAPSPAVRVLSAMVTEAIQREAMARIQGEAERCPPPATKPEKPEAPAPVSPEPGPTP